MLVWYEFVFREQERRKKKKKKSKNKNECPICLEPLKTGSKNKLSKLKNKLAKLKCKHVMHK